MKRHIRQSKLRILWRDEYRLYHQLFRSSVKVLKLIAQIHRAPFHFKFNVDEGEE